MSDLAPGTILGGDFELVRPLGEGGMGVVWLAHERPLGRDVALKLMRPSESPARERRFEREAHALAAVDHPSILPVLRTGTDPATGLHYIATRAVLLTPADIRRLCDDILHCPYPRSHVADAEEESHAECAENAENHHAESVECAEVSPSVRDARAGESLVTRPPSLVTAAAPPLPLPLPLSDLLEGGKALPEAAVLHIARDLAGALAAAHAAGILHRDIKPSNILLDADGRALLSDFGLAKFLQAHTGSPDGRAPSRPETGPGAAEAPDTLSLDEAGHPKFLGSPAYAAPETFRDGAASASPALDWYSFGAVLYEALTGQRPRSLRTPSSYDPANISRAWDSFLAALLDSDPSRRLADPAAIHRALDRIARRPARPCRLRRLWLLVPLFLAAAALVRFYAAPKPAAIPRADGAEGAAHRPVRPLVPAAICPPRLASIWQGDDRGPLQLLNIFRLDPVDRVVDEALAKADPEFRRLLQEGDAAWTASKRDVDAAYRAYSAAAEATGDSEATEGSDGGEPPDRLVCRAIAFARLCWTIIANGIYGASDEPYRKALASIAPLVEKDAARYAPLRSWLLAERAYMECMEDRFPEAMADLREANLLWELHVPFRDDPGSQVQSAVLRASFGGMISKCGETRIALEVTTTAIDDLAPLLPAYSDTLSDLLAGCHYRIGEIHKRFGNRLESLQNYRRALDIWRARYESQGERYRLTYAQVLGRIARAHADLREFHEAIALWDEMRCLLQPLLESDPTQYKSVVAGILRNCAVAYRSLGDEEAALAREAEAKALQEP